MGQKINPIGLRLGVNRTWDSRWYSSTGEYGKLLHEDMKICETLMESLKQAAISKIVIERPHKKCRVNIYSARPGVVIGKKGADIDKLRKEVAKLTKSEVAINIVEVRKPEIDATLVADLDRAAVGAPRCVPPRDEARGAVGDAPGRRGHPHQLLGAAGRRGNRASRMVPRGPRAAAYAARRCRLRRRHRAHRLWHLRHQGLDLQGRNPRARSDGAGQEDDGSRPFVDHRPRREPRERDRDHGRDAA